MYSAGYGFANNAAPSFNNPAPQQQSGAQPAAQQMMYNQQQQFAGMTPQGGFNPGANPQMMGAGPGGMMPNPGMQHMAANGQSTLHFFNCAPTPYRIYQDAPTPNRIRRKGPDPSCITEIDGLNIYGPGQISPSELQDSPPNELQDSSPSELQVSSRGDSPLILRCGL